MMIDDKENDMKLAYLFSVLLFSTNVFAHSTSIDMALQSITAAVGEYEQTNKDAQYYALDSWIQNNEFKAEVTQMNPLQDLATYTCHHQDQEGHDDHHTVVHCVLDKQGKPDGSLVAEWMSKENHFSAMKTAMSQFKAANTSRPADKLMQGFWNIRSYRKAGITKVKIRTAIAGDANKFREFTYSCNANGSTGCAATFEEKIVERKGN
jgi:hypothetical protein